MVLVLTPLTIEQEALSAALGPGGPQVIAAGHGKVQFALKAAQLIAEHKPRLVLGTGSCGALVDGLKPFDVVIATHTVEHDFRLRFVKKPLPSFPGDKGTLARLQAVIKDLPFRVHFGAMASGDEDVVDRERASQIHQETQALAVAWEGAGLARACRLYGVPFVEVRVVTDICDSAAPQKFKAHVNKGMTLIASLVRAVQ